jgi:HEPN domain-containing protein
MHDPKKIARAYLVEGEVDMQMARVAFINSFYSRAIFFAQQASEKAVKASLVMKGIFTNDHNMSGLFRALFEGKIDSFAEVMNAIERLERYGAKARFPLFQRADLPIWVPSESLKEGEARESLEKGELVFHKVRDYLEGEYLGKE